MKETHHSFIRSGMGALLLWLLLLTACVGEELQKPLLGEGEGYLTLQIGAIAAEVTSDPLTKATTQLDASIVPSINQLTINIKNKDTDEAVFTANPTKETITKVLKTGTYIVEAYYGTNEALQNTPYFYESDTVEVKALQTATTTIVAKLANAMLIPVVTDSLKRHYKEDWTLTASVGKTIFPLASATKGIDTLYAKAGETAFTFSGTNLAEKKVSFTWKETFAAGYAYQLQCNPNIDAFKSIKVKATAEHTYDVVSSYLTGTNITSFSADWNGADSAAIASWQVDVKYGEQTIRTYTGASLDSMTCAANDWPYIPKDCSLSASVTLKAGDVISDLKGTFTSLPAPDFKVSVSAYTSYDKYLKHDITAANNCQPETMYDIQASAKISADLLNNSNYNHSFQLLLDGDGIASSTSTTINIKEKDELSWASHTLKAVMTFAGSECSKESVHHITGLPYTLKHPANNYGWYKISGVDQPFMNDYILLSPKTGETPSVGSPAFHVPVRTIDFTLSCTYTRNVQSTFSSYTVSVFLLNSANKTTSSTVCEHTTKSKGTYTITGNTSSFSTDNNAVCCHYNYTVRGNTSSVNDLSITYR